MCMHACTHTNTYMTLFFGGMGLNYYLFIYLFIFLFVFISILDTMRRRCFMTVLRAGLGSVNFIGRIDVDVY